MNRWEVLHEVTLSGPWLFASLACYHAGGGWVLLGGVCSFFFFLTGLRQAHGCQHYQLPVPRPWQDWMLAGLSLLMLSSMHAVQATHLNHHRHTLDEHDFEGAVARQPMWRAIWTGPLFPVRLHRCAWGLSEAREAAVDRVGGLFCPRGGRPRAGLARGAAVACLRDAGGRMLRRLLRGVDGPPPL